MINTPSMKRAYAEVFKTPLGQKVLKDIFKICKIDRQTFSPGEPDVTAFNEGQRFVALYIARQCNMNAMNRQEDTNNGW